MGSKAQILLSNQKEAQGFLLWFILILDVPFFLGAPEVGQYPAGSSRAEPSTMTLLGICMCNWFLEFFS